MLCLQELLRARNDAMTKLAKATADMVEAKAEARRQGDLYRVTQTSLEECRALLAQVCNGLQVDAMM